MELELKNMYIIEEENEELKEEIKWLKTLSYDQKHMEVAKENE